MTRQLEVAAALVLAVFALVAAAQAWQMPVGGVERPGPGFFPLVLAVVLAGCALALLGVALLSRPAIGVSPGPLAWQQPARALGILLAYALTLERLGFLVATFIALGLLLRVVGRRRWGVTVTGAAAITLLVWGLFAWLGVRLPHGPWRF